MRKLAVVPQHSQTKSLRYELCTTRGLSCYCTCAKLGAPLMAVMLNEIVPWGRTFAEYERMFALTSADLGDGVLDCGGGPAGFTAEIAARGRRAVAVDPLYAFSAAEIRMRFEAVEGPMLAQVRATPDDWVWTYHRDLEDLRQTRRRALETFLADYQSGLNAGRYVVAELPELLFSNGAFGLAVCSHLLFLYSDLLSQEFHIKAVLELSRVAREARLFPLLTLGRVPSPHVGAVRQAVERAGLRSEIIQVDYELQRGGNQMLRVFRA